MVGNRAGKPRLPKNTRLYISYIAQIMAEHRMPTCSRSKNPRIKLFQKRPAALRTADDLIGAGLAPAGQRRAIEGVGKAYSIGVTETIANLIDRNDPSDPIA